MRNVLIGLVILAFSSCGPYSDTFFKEKASGHRAFGLEGVYIFTYKTLDSTESSDTLRFERVQKNNFLITRFSSKGTVYSGEILKRRGLYFMNSPSDQKDWWHIYAFKFTDDSVYNYWALHGYGEYKREITEEKLFSDYQGKDDLFYINNSSGETYDAMKFAVMNGERAGYREYYPNDDVNATRMEAEKKGQSGFLLYPNPVKDNLVIEAKADGKYTVEFIDINGHTVYKENFSENFFSMPVSTIPNGNYMARITELNKGVQNTFKVVVAK